MAIFEKIRKRSGLVILVIGTALAAFILGRVFKFWIKYV
jgi:hypothetical protein